MNPVTRRESRKASFTWRRLESEGGLLAFCVFDIDLARNVGVLPDHIIDLITREDNDCRISLVHKY